MRPGHDAATCQVRLMGCRLHPASPALSSTRPPFPTPLSPVLFLFFPSPSSSFLLACHTKCSHAPNTKCSHNVTITSTLSHTVKCLLGVSTGMEWGKAMGEWCQPPMSNNNNNNHRTNTVSHAPFPAAVSQPSSGQPFHRPCLACLPPHRQAASAFTATTSQSPSTACCLPASQSLPAAFLSASPACHHWLAEATGSPPPCTLPECLPSATLPATACQPRHHLLRLPSNCLPWPMPGSQSLSPVSHTASASLARRCLSHGHCRLPASASRLPASFFSLPCHLPPLPGLPLPLLFSLHGLLCHWPACLPGSLPELLSC